MNEALIQCPVLFYDDEIVAVRHDDTTVFVVFHSLCNNLNLERTSQVRRVQRHEVLREGLLTLPIQTEPG